MAAPTMPEREHGAGRDRRRMSWLIFVVIAFVVAAAGLWFFTGGDGGDPTVTFDGETAEYDGADDFDVGEEVTFTFDSSAYDKAVGFVVGRLVDDVSITMDELEAYAAENPADSVPPWADLTGLHRTFTSTDEPVVEKVISLREGEWVVLVATAPGDTNTAYPAAIIEVD